MCDEEGEASFFEDEDEQHSGIDYDSLDDNNPCFVLDDEEEYIEYLFRQETGFGSQNHFLSCNNDDSSRCWLRGARLHAIDWIFNVSFLH